MNKMMKPLIFLFLATLSVFLPEANAGGGLTHMFIAKESVARIPDPALRQLLQNNMDAYLVGAYYPDSGYVNGARYGEDSHWDPFIFAFADYLKATYPNPAQSNPRLTAFLFGCAAHRVSDEVIHWTFYNEMGKYDFKGDSSKAHDYGDLGIDILVEVDKNQWNITPNEWWVPIKDLLAVYRNMGLTQYTENEIIAGNQVISLASYGEKALGAFAYPYMLWAISWTAKHYYDWPQGGILQDEQKVAEYQMLLWQRLQGKSTLKTTNNKPSLNKMDETASKIHELAEEVLNRGAASIEVRKNNDGSVQLMPPVISKLGEFNDLLHNLLSKYIKWKI